jgi:hypothetical protein
VKALDEAAREIGVALAECGADPASRLVGELAGTLAELADVPAPRRRWRLWPMRRGHGRGPGAHSARRD